MPLPLLSTQIYTLMTMIFDEMNSFVTEHQLEAARSQEQLDSDLELK